MQDILVSKAELEALIAKKFIEVQVNKKHADIVAEILVHADLRGVSSHGVLRTEHYVKRIMKGEMNPNPHFQIERKGTAAILFDGDHGLGHVITLQAMKEAITLSKDHGIGIVGIKNSSHCGALSYYSMQATKKETISIIMTHTDSAVVPIGGKEAYFGTNPISFGFPANRHNPIILDMATSNVSLGKVLHAQETDKEIPADWGVDQNGYPVTNPNFVKYLLPMGGAKGYGLAMAIDLLTGVLTGAHFGPSITKMYGEYEKYRQLSHTIITIDPSLFIDKNQFLRNVDQMIDELHAVKPMEGFNSVMVPGEPEQLKEKERLKNGIPVPERIYNYLRS